MSNRTVCAASRAQMRARCIPSVGLEDGRVATCDATDNERALDHPPASAHPQTCPCPATPRIATTCKLGPGRWWWWWRWWRVCVCALVVGWLCACGGLWGCGVCGGWGVGVGVGETIRTSGKCGSELTLQAATRKRAHAYCRHRPCSAGRHNSPHRRVRTTAVRAGGGAGSSRSWVVKRSLLMVRSSCGFRWLRCTLCTLPATGAARGSGPQEASRGCEHIQGALPVAGRGCRQDRQCRGVAKAPSAAPRLRHAAPGDTAALGCAGGQWQRQRLTGCYKGHCPRQVNRPRRLLLPGTVRGLALLVLRGRQRTGRVWQRAQLRQAAWFLERGQAAATRGGCRPDAAVCTLEAIPGTACLGSTHSGCSRGSRSSHAAHLTTS